MFKNNKLIELSISIQLIIISQMIPIYISLPKDKNYLEIYNIPLNWQISSIIFLTILYGADLIFNSLIIYILIGLLLLPVFNDGGSLGYLITPNFGYVLGLFPLVKIINKLHKKNQFDLLTFLKYGTMSIFIMNLVGIAYLIIQLVFFNEHNQIIYNISKFSLGKILFEFLMLFPVLLFLKPFKKIKY